MAALILFQIPLAWQMIAMPPGMDKFEAYALHKSVGVTIFAVTALRLAWRLVHPPPPLPAGMSRRERLLAAATHGVLYLIVLAMPVSGWLYSSASAYSVSWFGFFVLPDLVPASEPLADALRWLHRGLAWLLLAVLALHVAAALFHHLVRRDNVLISMLPFAKLR